MFFNSVLYIAVTSASTILIHLQLTSRHITIVFESFKEHFRRHRSMQIRYV